MLVVLCLAPGIGFSQYAEIEWTRAFEDNDVGVKWARQKDMTVDSAGNVITATLVSPAYSKVLIRIHKWSPSGVLLWSYDTPTIAFYVDEEDITVHADASNNIVICGTKLSRLFAAKLSSSGSLLWSVAMPTSAPSADDWVTRSAALDSSGNVYLAGEVSIGYSAFHQVGVMKLASATGALLWQNLYGVSGQKLTTRVMAVSGSHLAVAAKYNTSTSELRLVSFNTSNGALRWATSYYSNFHQGEDPSSIAADNAGNYIVGGASANTQNSDLFVAKFSASTGSTIWENRYNGIANSDDWASVVLVNSVGDVFAAGSTQTPYVSGWLYQHDFLLMKLAGSTGSTLWKKQYQGPTTGDSQDQVAHACLDGAGNLIATGYSAVGHSDPFTLALRSSDGSRLWQHRHVRPGYYDDMGSFRVRAAPNGRCVIAFETDTEELGVVRLNPAITVGTELEDTTAVQLLRNFYLGGLAATVKFNYEYLDPLASRRVVGSSASLSLPASNELMTITHLLRGISPGAYVRFELQVNNSQGTFYLPGASEPQVRSYPMPPPVIDTDPASKLVTTGQTVSFTAAVSGGQPMSYQWRKNASNIAAPIGTSGTRCDLGAVTLTSAGRYSLKASNLRGTATTNEATLAVVNPIALAPAVAQGGSLVLTVSASVPSGTTLGYQWRRGGSNVVNGPIASGGTISGATTNKLTITKATDSEEGSYTCLVNLDTLPAVTVTATAQVVTKPAVTLNPVPAAIVTGDLTWQLVSSEPVLGYSISGLPSGLSYSASTGLITGKPKVSGSFKVKVTARNAAGSSSVQEFTLVIAPLPAASVGSFSGLLSRVADFNSSLGGSISLTSTSAGEITGTLKNGNESLAFKGSMVAPISGDPVATINIPRRGLASLTLSLTFTTATNGITGDLTDGTNTATLVGYQHTWSKLNPATAYQGNFNVTIDNSSAYNGIAYPQGRGWFQLSVSATGAVTGSGRTRDDQPFTFSNQLWPQAKFALFALLYKGRGSFVSQPTLTVDAANSLNDRVAGSFHHSKLPALSSADRLYNAGFTLASGAIAGSRWVAPQTGEMPMNWDVKTNNARLLVTQGGLSLAAQASAFPQTFTLAAKGTSLFDKALNLCAATCTVNPKTGGITGSFKLSDPIAPGSTRMHLRTVSYTGLMIPHLNNGFGCFTLPQLPLAGETLTTSPMLVGRVDLQPQ